MDKKSVIRFASLMTAVLISASSFPRLCATVSAEQAIDPVTAAAGEASLVSYKTYAADMTERKSAEKSITLSSDAARVYGSAARKGVNGKSAVVFSKTGCGAEWKVSVPEDALYNIRLSYTAVDTGVDYAFTLTITFFTPSGLIPGACPSCGKKMANIPGLTAMYVSASPSKKVISFSAL